MGPANKGELEHAARLGIKVRAVRDLDITPGEAGALLAARSGWLIAEERRRQAQTKREAGDRLRREVTDALVISVHEAWLRELKHAASDADIDAINAQRAAEVWRARQEARQLAGELIPEQVRARIGRERGASCQAACYRSAQLLRRGLGDGDGQV